MAIAAQLSDRLLSFVQIGVIAALFGASRGADLYFVVSIVPVMLGYVVGDTLGRAFVTSLSNLKEQESAPSLVAAGFVLSAAILVALNLVYVTAVMALVPALHPVGSGPAVWLVFSLVIPLLGLNGYLGGILIWLGRYAWSSMRFPLATLGGTLLIALLTLAGHRVLLLAIAVTAGYGLVTVALLVQVRRALGPRWFVLKSPHSLRAAWGMRGKVLVASLGGLMGGQVIVMVERALALSLGTGAVAVLSYARGIVSAPAMIGFAVGWGLYPALVRADAAGADAHLRESFVRGLRLVFFVGGTFAVYFALFGTDLVRLLFQRGAFHVVQADRTGHLLVVMSVAAMAGGIIFYAAQVLYGMNRFSGIFFLEGTIFPTYCILALSLRELSGLTGLAAAFAIAQTVGALAGIGLVARRLRLSLQTLVRGVVMPIAARLAVVAAPLVAYRGLMDVIAPSGLWGTIVGAVGGGACLVVVGVTVLLFSLPEAKNVRVTLAARLVR